MASHTALNGRIIEYEPTPAEERYLRRVEAAAADPAVKETELCGIIFGPDSPVFDPHAGYAFVSAAGLESAVLRVALDLLDRKRAAIGAIDPERIAAQYTRSVDDAAQQLGVSDSTIRMAITQQRLPSWLRDGKLWLTAEHVAAVEVSGRGRLAVTCGNHDGASMRIRVIGGELEVARKHGHIVEGHIERWTQVGVITGLRQPDGSGTTYRYSLLEPGGPEQSVALEPFRVTGRFTIVERKRDKAASEAFAALGREGGSAPPATGR